jgi:hypothetical protein
MVTVACRKQCLPLMQGSRIDLHLKHAATVDGGVQWLRMQRSTAMFEQRSRLSTMHSLGVLRNSE